ncbi:MAG: asparagine synthase (glutamine-hydrolyzing) [Oscillospiraceae bacterium]|nr:asparagine synthase (glutamine-hydrolyzing) [Oscillospiraceae bacterium]
MCGIAGFCDYSDRFTCSDEKAESAMVTLKRMREVIAHRGCDQTGEYLRKYVGLSHTRLSIRDVSNGIQPMIGRKDGCEYAIVFNGEIYNTEEIISDLRERGVSPNTTCDTEVILLAYMEYGKKCVEMLNGIFAFAIWDFAEEKLFIARDRAGVKPLFYTFVGDTFVFGSEIKALFEYPGVVPTVSLDSFREIFEIGPVRTGGCGVFEGIYELDSGCCGWYDRNGLTVERYWDLKSEDHTDSYEQTVDRVSYLLRDAVRRQMVSDVPVCSFLSGGIDSSIVTAIAAQVIRESGGTLSTFSFDFKGNDIYFKSNSFQPEPDRPYVDIMLSQLNTNHTYLECDEEELADMLYDAVCAKDLPGMTDVDASLLYFCRKVKENNKVAVTGECADEIFGGYPWFYRKDLLEGDGFPWSRDMTVRESLLRDDFAARLDLEDYAHERYLDSVRRVPLLDGESGEEAKRRQITYLNIKWFMQTLLDRMDRTSMYSGLEARVPFADHRIMEYVFNVPWSMKRRNDVEKSLLRDAFKDILPPQLFMRKKSPYPKTYNPNYQRILRERLTAVVNDSSSPIQNIVDVKKVFDFLEQPDTVGKPWFGQLMTSVQMAAYILQINFWLKKYRPAVKI